MNKFEAHIMVVDDDDGIRNLVKKYLNENNFLVTTANNAEDAEEKVKVIKFDLIVLDIMMPGESGLDFISKNKGKYNTPIILLTAKGEANERVEGLEVGADDYVIKPFSISVLTARIKSILRRNSYTEKSSINSFEELSIEVNSREVYVDKKRIDLTYTEFEILRLLSSHHKWVYTRDQIIDNVHGEDYAVTDRSIDFQIVGLRKKLGSASRFIKTIRGVGYRFVIDD